MKYALEGWGTRQYGLPRWGMPAWGSPGFDDHLTLGLKNGGVSPSSGNIDTSFTFRVTWIDEINGLLPTSVTVHINAGSFPMTLESGNATDGAVYAYTTQLTRVPHAYYFESAGPVFRLPDTGTYSGPSVNNRLPVLSAHSVTPGVGNIDDDYIYEVTYTDADGDAASATRNVIIDDISHQMAVHSGSDPKLGIVFRHTESNLDRLPHKFRFEFSDGLDTVLSPPTGEYSGPTVNNRIPVLSVGSVVPTSGNASSTFVYEVTYEDADGDIPTNVSVWINGVQYSMTYISGDYITGALYRYSTTLAEDVPYTFYFTCSDGNGGTDRLPAGEYDGPVVANTAPVLTLGGVTPSSGNALTTFTYEIIYTDVDGDAPTYVRVNIDGTDYDMSLFSGSDPVVGLVYRYETTLTPDVAHEFHFTTSDGTNPVRLPTSSEITGPDVASNAAPELTAGGVAPASGDTNTTFVYEVTYTDADNDAPTGVSVWINNTEYAMSYVSGDYDIGALYRYSTTLPEGADHEYYFTASDSGGGGSDRLPATDAYSGPLVEAASELVINGEFDSNITGWTAGIYTGQLSFQSGEGNPAGSIRNNNVSSVFASTIYQILGLEVGKLYNFSFDFKQFTSSIGDPRVYVGPDDNPNNCRQLFSATGSTTWQTHSGSFTAQSGETYMHFGWVGSPTGRSCYLDNISVKEPQ